MNENDLKRTSKFLSHVLRHRPDKIGIELDSSGWVDINELLEAANRHGKLLTHETLETVVQSNDKQRFSFSEDGSKMRANQGHSVEVELEYEAAEPPTVLYHGTVAKFLNDIRRVGLQKGSRHDVHLSPTLETATAVGSRRGKPIILTIHARKMHEAGFQFFVTPNNVWLTDHVPSDYIEFPLC